MKTIGWRRREETRRVAVVVVTGDRGLAGPFNGQVLRRAFELAVGEFPQLRPAQAAE